MSEMNYAQEQGLWSAIGGVERDVEHLDERLIEVERHAARATWWHVAVSVCWLALAAIGLWYVADIIEARERHGGPLAVCARGPV